MPEVVAGFVTLPGGMNGQVSPLVLPDAQCARALNLVFRDGAPATRPGFVKLSDLPEGEFRGMGRWSLEFSDFLACVFGDTLYIYTCNTGTWQEFPEALPGTSSCYFTQVHKFLVVQDGHNTPICLAEEGGLVRQVPSREINLTDAGSEELTRTIPDIPPGTLGVYAHGRYHLVPSKIPNTEESGRTSLVSGDITLPEEPVRALAFSENEYLAEGGANGLPLEIGQIGGLGVMRNTQGGTGYGAVIVFGRNGSVAFDFSQPRTQWKQGAFSSVLFFGAGCRSPRSITNVNSDLVYRAPDGLRTLRYSASMAQGANLMDMPLSPPVDTFMEADASALHNVSAAFLDNRMYWTSGGQQGIDDRFWGILPLDTQSGGPVFDGMWTGPAVRQITSAFLEGNPVLYALCDGGLYGLDPTMKTDPGGQLIESRLETKTYTFASPTGGGLDMLKKLQYLELWFTDVYTSLEVRAWYRPHGFPRWRPFLGPRKLELAEGTNKFSWSKLRFGIDFNDVVCDPVSKIPLFHAEAFQFAIQWTGHATLERLRAVAEAVPPAVPEPCDDEREVSLPDGLGEDLHDFSYTWT